MEGGRHPRPDRTLVGLAVQRQKQKPLAKGDRSYAVEEATRARRIHKVVGTTWLKTGLQPINQRSSSRGMKDLDQPPLRVADVAAYTRKHPKTVRRWISKGHLPASRSSGQWFIRQEDLARFLDPDANEGPGPKPDSHY